jgi:hypothetical protein
MHHSSIMMTALCGATPLVLEEVPFSVKGQLLVVAGKIPYLGETRMELAGFLHVSPVRTALVLSISGIIASLCPVTLSAQADYQLHATPVFAAPVDRTIVLAISNVSEQRIQRTIEKLVSFNNRSTLSSMEKDLGPGTGINAAADWISAQFEEISKTCGGCLEVKRDTFIADPSAAAGTPWAKRIPKPTQLTNVYAILRGTDPVQAKRMYLVTGHYDSRNSDTLNDHDPAPGANDDASGVAVSLECARTLSQLKLPASLVFVAVAGEEQGLVGSAHLAQLAKAEGWKLEGVLNNDIVGGNTTPGDTLQRKDVVRVFSEGIPLTATPEQEQRIRALGSVDDAPSRQLARAMADVARTYLAGSTAERASGPAFGPFLVSRPDRYLRGGDHTSFNKEGFTAVRITEWREDFDHQHQNVRVENGIQYGDLLQFVDFGYVARVAKLNAATLAALAASPGIPVGLKVETTKLENGTTFTWKAPEGAGPGLHYELLWRETTAPDWQYVQNVPAGKVEEPVSLTVPISKDNVIFGVRAVDAAGHRGLVATP